MRPSIQAINVAEQSVVINQSNFHALVWRFRHLRKAAKQNSIVVLIDHHLYQPSFI
jgi:hypothetical protein